MLTPVLYGLLLGLRRGIIRELTAVITIFAAYLCAKWFAPMLATYMSEYVTWDMSVIQSVAYSVVFIGTALVLSILSRLITRLLRAISLGWLNRLLGCVFGAAKWVLIMSVLLNIFDLADQHFNLLQPEKKAESKAYKPMLKIASIAWETASENIDNDNLNESISFPWQ